MSDHQSQPLAFGFRLHQAMKSAGVNKAQLARALGVSPTCIKNWLTGRIPRADEIPAICARLGVSMAWLLTGKEDPTSQGDSGLTMKPPAPAEGTCRRTYWKRRFLQTAHLSLQKRNAGDIPGARYWARHSRADYAAWKGGDPAPNL